MEIKIYDNNGKTADRYTVIIKEGKWFDVYAMSEDALAPDGFNQYSFSNQEVNYKTIGKKRLFNELPMDVRQAIMDRMISEN